MKRVTFKKVEAVIFEKIGTFKELENRNGLKCYIYEKSCINGCNNIRASRKKYHLSQNYDYGIIPFLFQIFILYFNKHGSRANLHRTFIPLFPSLNHPIFSFYVFTVLKRAFRIFWSRMAGIHVQLVALRARDFEARARPALLRSILRIVSGYPVAVFSGKMNRFTTNNFPWASTRPHPRTDHSHDGQ